jgi:hypothetical protein
VELVAWRGVVVVGGAVGPAVVAVVVGADVGAVARPAHGSTCTSGGPPVTGDGTIEPSVPTGLEEVATCVAVAKCHAAGVPVGAARGAERRRPPMEAAITRRTDAGVTRSRTRTSATHLTALATAPTSVVSRRYPSRARLRSRSKLMAAVGASREDDHWRIATRLAPGGGASRPWPIWTRNQPVAARPATHPRRSTARLVIAEW